MTDLDRVAKRWRIVIFCPEWIIADNFDDPFVLCPKCRGLGVRGATGAELAKTNADGMPGDEMWGWWLKYGDPTATWPPAVTGAEMQAAAIAMLDAADAAGEATDE